MADVEEACSLVINNPGAYPTCCVQLSLDSLAVNTVLQSPHINDYEGASGSSISFDGVPQVSTRLGCCGIQCMDIIVFVGGQSASQAFGLCLCLSILDSYISRWQNSPEHCRKNV